MELSVNYNDESLDISESDTSDFARYQEPI